MNQDFTLSKIIPEDKTEMKKLASNNGGNQNLSEAFIDHWYFNNPSNSKSLWKVVMDGSIEGFATTNNFKFNIDNKECLVAMSQNVLTSTKVRGKGLFNKLYLKTEEENIEENKVDYFLTVTNKLSTPIFINKFNYVRGKCPLVLLTFFNVFDLFSKIKYKRLSDINSIDFPHTHYCFNNAMKKNRDHFKWRYNKYATDKLHVIAILEHAKTIGYAILKSEKKKGVKILILMDIICVSEESIPLIIEGCYVYTTKNYFLAMLMFDIYGKLKRKKNQLSFKEKFNFLVKGKSQEDTKMLSQTNFNLFFGDLDIV